MTEAIGEYREAEDPIGLFLAEKCKVTGKATDTVAAGLFFDSYDAWATKSQLTQRERLTATKFGRIVRSRFQSRKSSAVREYLGVIVLSDH
jgi:phage/plasmid-associated DNA primase